MSDLLVHLPTSGVVHFLPRDADLRRNVASCGAGPHWQGGWDQTTATEITTSPRLRMCLICIRQREVRRPARRRQRCCCCTPTNP